MHMNPFELTGLLGCPHLNANMVPWPAQHDVNGSSGSGKNMLTVLTASQQGQQL